jgi:hypothetical protein
VEDPSPWLWDPTAWPERNHSMHDQLNEKQLIFGGENDKRKDKEEVAPLMFEEQSLP